MMLDAIDDLGQVIAHGSQRLRAHGDDCGAAMLVRSQGRPGNPPNSFSTLYLAAERRTVVQEFERMVSRAGLSVESWAAPRSTPIPP
jgi:hypothetical protein